MEEIRQDGKTMLSSTDGSTIKIIFNNLTGRNFDDKKEYQRYRQFAMAYGFHAGTIERYENGELKETANF